MKKTITLFIVLTFILISNSYSQWTKLNSGTSLDLNQVSFPLNDTGYVLGVQGELYKTLDNGQTWQFVDSTSLKSMKFATVDSGFGCDWNHDVYITTNGGMNWTSTFHDNNFYLWQVFLLDNTYFVSGANYFADTIIVLKSIDGGNTWITSYIPGSIFSFVGPTSLFFINQNVGFLTSMNHIYKTVDSGLNWNVSFYDSLNSYMLTNLYFLSLDTGFVLTTFNTILRTLDGGLNWNQVNAPGNNGWNNMRFVNGTGYTVGGTFAGGYIIKSIDGGLNWIVDTNFSTGAFNDIVVTKNKQTFACGNGGIIVRLDARPQPDICFVSVDSTTGKNMIIWEKDHQHLPKKYNIFKESTSAGVYNLLDTVAGNAFSTYIDNTSNPAQKADRYKISFVDSNAAESAQSVFHKTIHLTMSKGIGNSWNLIWDHYQGFPFYTYYILRGNYSWNLSVIDSVQSNLTSYTDLNPPAGEIYYAIQVIKPGGCNPSFIKPKYSPNEILWTYGSSLSNIVNRLSIGVDAIGNNDNWITISPNPLTTSSILQLNTQVKDAEVVIYDMLGKEMVRKKMDGDKTELEKGSLESGVYFVSVKDEQRQFTQKLIVE